MKVISLGRGEGKTTRLVEWAREDEKHSIIVPTQQDFHRLVNQECYLRDDEDPGERKLLRTWQLLTVKDALGDHMRSRKFRVRYAIDELPAVLCQLGMPVIDLVTLTEDGE